MEVIVRLQEDGVLAQTFRDVTAQTCVARAATDISLYNRTDVVASMAGGDEMLQLAVEVLKAKHGSLPDGDMDENWKRHAAGLVASLMRVSLIELRDTMTHGHVGDKDMAQLAEFVPIGSAQGVFVADNRLKHGMHRPHQALQKMIAERGDLVSTESITKMISDAANRVTSQTSGRDLDNAVRDHVAEAAQQFVDKIVWEVFADETE
jgi:hypothetical protein